MKNILIATSLVCASLPASSMAQNRALNFDSHSLQSLVPTFSEKKGDKKIEINGPIKAMMPNSYDKISEKKNLIDEASHVTFLVADKVLSVQLEGIIQNLAAINIQELGLVVINSQRLDGIYDRVLREAIALHEFFSLKGWETTGYYPYSSQYLFQKGLDVRALENALYVDRIKQISAERPGITRHEILEKFFEEANMPISFSDILQGRRVDGTYANSSQCAIENYYKNEQIVKAQLLRSIYIIKNEVPEIPSLGPLLPAVPAIPAETISRLELLETVGASRFWDVSNSVLSIAPNEITQQHLNDFGIKTDVKLQVRKNNGLITFKVLEKMHEEKDYYSIRYGYCY